MSKAAIYSVVGGLLVTLAYCVYIAGANWGWLAALVLFVAAVLVIKIVGTSIHWIMNRPPK